MVRYRFIGFNFKKNILKKNYFFIYWEITTFKGVINYLNSANYILKKYRKKVKFQIAGIIDDTVNDSVPIKKLEFLARKFKL